MQEVTDVMNDAKLMKEHELVVWICYQLKETIWQASRE